MRGKFISIEGNDGSGKSTVIKALQEELRKLNIDVVFTREPGGSPIAEKIRHLILDPDNDLMDDRTEALLYAASRRQHIVETIEPALRAGKVVVCDRFIDSSLAYQGCGRDLGVNNVYQMNLFATNGLLPDLTIYALVEPKLGLKRKSNQKSLDRLEKEQLPFHLKVYESYLELAKLDPNRIKIVNGDQNIDDEIKDVLEIIMKFLGVI